MKKVMKKMKQPVVKSGGAGVKVSCEMVSKVMQEVTAGRLPCGRRGVTRQQVGKQMGNIRLSLSLSGSDWTAEADVMLRNWIGSKARQADKRSASAPPCGRDGLVMPFLILLLGLLPGKPWLSQEVSGRGSLDCLLGAVNFR